MTFCTQRMRQSMHSNGGIAGYGIAQCDHMSSFMSFFDSSYVSLLVFLLSLLSVVSVSVVLQVFVSPTLSLVLPVL